MKFQCSIFEVKDLIESISAAIGFMWSIRCALYSAFEAYYGAHYPVSNTLTVSPVKSNEIPVFNFKVKDLIGRISAAIGLGRQFDARYTPHLKRNTEHIIRFSLY
jgi:hypothetical protein